MFLKKIDFLSPKITLWRNGESSHSSTFSGILTLFTFIAIVTIGIILSLDSLEKKNPSAFYFNGYVEDAGFFPLNSNSMFNFIQIMNSENGELDPIDYDSVRIIGLRQVINMYSTSDRNLSNLDHWIYGNCNKDSDIKGIENIITDDIYKNSACVRKYFNKNEQKYYNTNEKGFIWPSVDKGCSNPNKTYYGIIVEECRNDSLKQGCKNIKDIKKYFSRHSVDFRFINQCINLFDYKNPLIKEFNYISNGLFEGSYTTNHLNFNPAKVVTHSGIIFDNQKDELSYLFEQNEKVTTTWEKNDTGIYVAFYFWMQNQMQYYERSYKKIVNILADIGGISNTILFIVKFINKLVNKYVDILDSQDLIINLDKKLAIKYNNNSNIIKFHNLPKSQQNIKLNFKKNEENNDKKPPNILIRNIENDLGKNTVNNNENYNNQSVGTKNLFLANNLLNNDNLIINFINKKRNLTINNCVIPDLKKRTVSRQYKSVEKISFNFIDYLFYLLCNKKNEILKFEDFKRKIISEEQIIQSYIKLYKLLNVFDINNNIKKNDNIDLNLIMNFSNKYIS